MYRTEGLKYTSHISSNLQECELHTVIDQATQGDIHAMVQLGKYYLTRGDHYDEKSGKKWLLAASDAGNSDAMLLLGEDSYMDEKYRLARRWYKAAADLGNSEAMRRMGDLYFQGEGIRENIKIAHMWYRKSAQAGNGTAAFQLAMNYRIGEVVPCNYSESLTYFIQAAHLGVDAACTEIGNLYSQGGPGLDQNLQQAIRWYKQGVNAGDEWAMLFLGELYEYGMDPPHYDDAFTWYSDASSHGNDDAMIHLCDLYRYGRGQQRSLNKFLHWAVKAATTGNERGRMFLYDPFFYYNEPDLMPYRRPAAVAKLKANGSARDNYLLAKLCASDINTQGATDEKDAFVYMRKAAEQGERNALYEAGLMYDLGIYTNKDVTQAVSMHQRASEAGHLSAMERLAVHYLSGSGVEKNPERGLHWIRQAAAGGHPSACLTLGYLYMEGSFAGMTVPLDDVQSYKWMQRAADHGNAEAMFQLSSMYFLGDGVRQNREQGQYWMQISADLGYKNAIQFLAVMKEEAADSPGKHLS